MPYIKQEDRDDVHPQVAYVAQDSGQLNYQISSLCQRYMQAHGLRYASMNDVIGALEGAKMEFNRVVVGPYEDKKIAENGGVYR